MSSKAKTHVLILIPLMKQTLTMLRDEFPKVEFHHHPVKSWQETPRQIAEKAEIVITDDLIPPVEDVPAMQWLHIIKTVVDARVLQDTLLKKSNLVVTNNSGVTSPAYADLALMQMYALGYRLLQICQAQEKQEFPLENDRYPVSRVYDSTVGIVGYGSVGRELARILHGFGVKVLASKRDLMHPEDDGYNLPEHGDPGGDYFQRLYPPQAIGSMVRECDFVVITLPYTAETHGLISADILSQMKPHANLINLSVPEVVDLEALREALLNRQFRGASLLQFADHPFPEDSDFWSMEQVIVLPAIKSLVRNEEEKAVLLLIENFRQYLNGGPLINRIDFERGY